VGVCYKARMPPHLKCSLVCCSRTLRSTVRCTSIIQPAAGTPYPQVSQVSGTDLPVQKTRITAFSEDYPWTGSTSGARSSPGGSPSGYLMSRFGTSAINPHPSTLQTQVSKGTNVRLQQTVAVTQPANLPGTPHPKSAHPDVQVHQ
jgi:hypothetical protein